MPELPEVETIARGLDPVLRGRQISRIEAIWPRTIDARSEEIGSASGERIVLVRRAGKQVAIALRSGRTLVIHLRMTGRLLVVRGSDRIPHERAAIHFVDGERLAFGDARKFGRLRLIDGDVASALEIGVDPFDVSLDADGFAALFARRATPIKSMLLDQRRLSGVGNIYACEALFRARIRPKRRSGSLTKIERSRLLGCLRKVLEKAIASRGSSVDDYVDAEGMPGAFQKLLNVYGRAGLPCRRCRTPIKRIVMAQRGTFYCPACQR